MEIKIYKQNDEIFIEYGEINDVLNFESLKKLSKLFLDKKIKNEDTNYSINTNNDTSLLIYDKTVKEVIDSIIKDDELIDLFKENKKDE